MVSIKEKEEILKTLLLIPSESKQAEMLKKLHKLLLQETNQGKLYKYQPFDLKGHSLDNLKNGTLYCSEPDTFNDPFDCKIGISFTPFLDEKYSTELHFIESVFTKYLNILNDKMGIKNCNAEEWRIIRKLLANKKIKNFLIKNYGRCFSDEDASRILFENSYVINEFMQIVLSDNYFPKAMRDSLNTICSLYNNLSPEGFLAFTKADTRFEDLASMCGISEDADEIDLIVSFHQKFDSLHPDEEVEFEQQIHDIEHMFIDKVRKSYRVGCLCTDYKNRLMWSHYADSYKGFCVEYDFSLWNEKSIFSLPFPISYSENRPIIPWYLIYDKFNKNDFVLQVLLSLLAKDKAWEYENEWRFLIDSSQSPHLVMPQISCIYLGTNINDENYEEIMTIAREKKIPVKKMTVDRGSYALHAKNEFF